MRKWFAAVVVLGLVTLWWAAAPRATPQQRAMVRSARTCLGDVYDSRRFEGGPPPRGRGACTDVVWRACLPVVDLQAAVARDRPGGDRDLDYRWCPFLIQWFQKHALSVEDWQPGDIVFFVDAEGVAYHTGVVSDRRAWDGNLLVIHNGGPVCSEDNRLAGGGVGGHFRLRGR